MSDQNQQGNAVADTRDLVKENQSLSLIHI